MARANDGILLANCSDSRHKSSSFTVSRHRLCGPNLSSPEPNVALLDGTKIIKMRFPLPTIADSGIYRVQKLPRDTLQSNGDSRRSLIPQNSTTISPPVHLPPALLRNFGASQAFGGAGRISSSGAPVSPDLASTSKVSSGCSHLLIMTLPSLLSFILPDFGLLLPPPLASSVTSPETSLSLSRTPKCFIRIPTKSEIRMIFTCQKTPTPNSSRTPPSPPTTKT